MAVNLFNLFNLVRMTVSGSPGTGTITLLAAVPGFLTASQAGLQIIREVSYAIREGNNREVGRGIYNPSGFTLTRGVINSTNSNALVSFTSAAVVSFTAIAEDFLDAKISQGDNLLIDGGFEDGMSHWQTILGTVTQGIAGAPGAATGSDDSYLVLNRGAATAQAFSDEYVPCYSGELFDISAFIRGDVASTFGAYVGCVFYDKDLVGLASQFPASLSNQPLTTSWVFKGGTVSATAGARFFKCRLYHFSTSTATEMYVDNVIIRRVLDREKLTANRTYWVRTDGNDANSGLANSAVDAKLTLQSAYDAVKLLDFNGFTVVIQLGDGTYLGTAGNGLVINSSWLGGGELYIQGNATTPANVHLNQTGQGILVNFGVVLSGKLTARNMKISGNNCINNSGVGDFAFSNIVFNGNAFQVCAVGPGAKVSCAASYSITLGCSAHMLAITGGTIDVSGATVTLTGTPAFATGFAYATRRGFIVSQVMTYVGSATGPRFYLDSGGGIYTDAPIATGFPGNAAGVGDGTGFYLNQTIGPLNLVGDLNVFGNIWGNDLVVIENIISSRGSTAAFNLWKRTGNADAWYIYSQTGDFDLFDLVAGADTFNIQQGTGSIKSKASAYHNFGTVFGTLGYGLRDNAGVVETKNSGGAWARTLAGGGRAAGTTSTTSQTGNLHQGLGTTYTMKKGTTLFVMAYGRLTVPGAGQVVTAQLRFGTGAGPANAAAAAGTIVGTQGANQYAIGGFLTGLVLGTTYWFDVSHLHSAAGSFTATANDMQYLFLEIPAAP